MSGELFVTGLVAVYAELKQLLMRMYAAMATAPHLWNRVFKALRIMARLANILSSHSMKMEGIR